MASSSTYSSKETDNQTDKLDQTSEFSDESKKVLPTSSLNVKETINEKDVIIVKHHKKEQQNDFSPDLIEKQSIASLSACPVNLRLKREAQSGTIREPTVLPARPYEEILVSQPNTDIPSTKSDDGNSSSTKRLA